MKIVPEALERGGQLAGELGHHIVHTHWNRPRWRGVRVEKFPNDLLLYAQAIMENKPDIIIESGTSVGGSALFFGDVLSLVGNGRVISIDIKKLDRPEHPNVEYLLGSSVDLNIVDIVRKSVDGKSVMAIFDSVHKYNHIKKELALYSGFITSNQYLVVEDIYWPSPGHDGDTAIKDFLFSNPDFKRVPIAYQFLNICVSRDGWLLRK